MAYGQVTTAVEVPVVLAKRVFGALGGVGMSSLTIVPIPSSSAIVAFVAFVSLT